MYLTLPPLQVVNPQEHSHQYVSLPMRNDFSFVIFLGPFFITFNFPYTLPVLSITFLGSLGDFLFKVLRLLKVYDFVLKSYE